MSESGELVWTNPTADAWWAGLSAEIDETILSAKKACLSNSNLSEDTELESVESPPKNSLTVSALPLPIPAPSWFLSSGAPPSIPLLKQRLVEMLARFEFTQAIDTEGIQETLCELEQIQPEASQIENSRILKTLKIVVNLLNSHTDIKAKAYVLYLQWKHIVLQHEIMGAAHVQSALSPPRQSQARTKTKNKTKTKTKVNTNTNTKSPKRKSCRGQVDRNPVNWNLRKKVCRKIARTLQDNKFDVLESQTLALSIESNIRQRDPAMKRPYLLLFKCMIRDIKRLDRDKYIKFAKY